MKTVRLIIASATLALMLSVSASAQSEPPARGILAVGKMAGACGILDSMIQFQKTTRMEGGDAFVARFWSVEAARLGMSVEQLSAKCDQSVSTYGNLWDAAESP